MLQQTRLTIAQRTMVESLEQYASSLREVASSLADVGRSDLAWTVTAASAGSSQTVLRSRPQVRETVTAHKTTSRALTLQPQTRKDMALFMPSRYFEPIARVAKHTS